MAVSHGSGRWSIQHPSSRALSLPTQEQRMFNTSSWLVDPTGSPRVASPSGTVVEVPLEEL
jgi:hypothetical protein